MAEAIKELMKSLQSKYRYTKRYKLAVPKIVPIEHIENAMLLKGRIHLLNSIQRERLISEELVPKEWFSDVSETEYQEGWHDCMKHYGLEDNQL